MSYTITATGGLFYLLCVVWYSVSKALQQRGWQLPEALEQIQRHIGLCDDDGHAGREEASRRGGR